MEPDKRADVLPWSVPSHRMVINRFGVNLADTMIVSGRIVVRRGRLAVAYGSPAKEVNAKGLGRAQAVTAPRSMIPSVSAIFQSL